MEYMRSRANHSHGSIDRLGTQADHSGKAKVTNAHA